MSKYQEKIDIIVKSCECNICWEVKQKFRVLKCNHEICTTCFPRIRNNLCPFCRNPINTRNTRSINIPNDRNNHSSNFTNLSLDDNLLLDFAESFDDLHITGNNRINRRRNRRRYRRNRRRNRRRNVININDESTINSDEEEINNEVDASENTNGNTNLKHKNRKKSKIRNRKSNRWNSLRNQRNFYRNSY